jgi:hypothetical protein
MLMIISVHDFLNWPIVVFAKSPLSGRAAGMPCAFLWSWFIVVAIGHICVLQLMALARISGTLFLP